MTHSKRRTTTQNGYHAALPSQSQGKSVSFSNWSLSFMPKIAIVSCPMCLAVYERRKERHPQKERGAFTCSCGHVIARWNGHWALVFTKIKGSSVSPPEGRGRPREP